MGLLVFRFERLLTAFNYCHCFQWLPAVSALAFHSFQKVVAFKHHSKCDVLIIQPLRLRQCYDKLTPIAVAFPAIAHGQHVGSIVVHFKIFVLKHASINAFTSNTSSMSEVSSFMVPQKQKQ